jgi:uncharacterized membrane protein YoaK (UPF0700 family)
MTTNLTQFAVDLAGATSRKKRSPEANGLQQQRARRLYRYGAAFAGFVAGTAAGALLFPVAGLAAGIVPALLVLALVDMAGYTPFTDLFPSTHRNKP